MKVQPIRDFSKFVLMQKLLMRDGKVRECLLLQTLYNTNLRIADALRLRWEMVIDENGAAKDHFNMLELKTGKSAWRPIPNDLQSAFAGFFAKYRPRLADYVFRSESPKIRFRNVPWHRNHPYKIIKQYAAMAGIKDNVGAHSSRKTWAWHYYNNGGDLELLRLEMNHANIRTTLIYAGIEEDQRRKDYEKLSQLNAEGAALMSNMPNRTPTYRRRKPPKTAKKKRKKPEKIRRYARRIEL